MNTLETSAGAEEPESANPLLSITSKEDLAIAHRQWIRADKLRRCFQGALTRTTDEERREPSDFYLTDAGTFMLVWYGVLYSVLEFVVEKGADLTRTDPNFGELYDTLRRLRNSVFHAENKYWDTRQIELARLNDAVPRIHNIHDQLGAYFLDALDKKA